MIRPQTADRRSPPPPPWPPPLQLPPHLYTCCAGNQLEDGPTRLLDAQRARQATEEDRRRLKNRVRQLEREGVRVERRIVETRDRVRDVLELQKRNRDRQAEKLRAQEKELEEVVQLRAEQYEAKGVHLRKKNIAQKKLQKEKQLSSAETREKKQRYQEERESFRVQQLVEAQRNMEEIRKAQAQAQNRLRQKKKEHVSEVKDNYRRRLEDERAVLAKNEEELQRMAEHELGLIEKLKVKQQEQMVAYEELQKALGLEGEPQGPDEGELGVPGEPDEYTVRQAFMKFDTEGEGRVPRDKFQALLETLGLKLSKQQVQESEEQLDPEGTGFTSYGDFLMWWNG